MMGLYGHAINIQLQVEWFNLELDIKSDGDVNIAWLNFITILSW